MSWLSSALEKIFECENLSSEKRLQSCTLVIGKIHYIWYVSKWLDKAKIWLNSCLSPSFFTFSYRHNHIILAIFLWLIKLYNHDYNQFISEKSSCKREKEINLFLKSFLGVGFRTSCFMKVSSSYGFAQSFVS